MSAKTSNQPGRRTPLSLSGGITKGQPNNTKGGGNSANGHTNNKQDNKNQQNKTEQQTDAKENPAKVQNKQQNETKIPKPQTSQNSDNSKSQKQNDNKKTSEKQQNGVAATAANSNKTNSGNQQQQANKDKQSNGNDVKSNENDKKLGATQEIVEKDDNNEKEKDKSQEKSEKDDKKSKDDKKEQDSKKEQDLKNEQDLKKELDLKKEQDLKKDDRKAKEDIKESDDNKKDQKSEKDNKKTNVAQTESQETSDESPKEQKDAVENMDVVEEEPQQKQDAPKSAPATPKTVKDSKKTATPSKTPTKVTEKTPTKVVEKTTTKVAEKSSAIAAEKTPPKSKPPTIREVTTAIDDVDMEPLIVDQSPSKVLSAETLAGLAPCATSTPGKIVLPKRNVPAAKTDLQLAMQSSSSPERPRAFSQISGRRGIRPVTDYTPSKFQSNLQFRESYRRINTELDATNTSLNVTVGSEVPNNSSFSFFGRGRKRDRTPPHHSQSAIGELQTDMEVSPPKRARLDFFSAVSSPLTLLRNRFSKANLQSSTPVKLEQKLNENEDDIEVQNVSGVSVHEDIEQTEDERENTEEGDTTLGVEATADTIHSEGELEIGDNGDKELSLKSERQISEDGDIKITVTDTVAKNKRCIVM